MSQPDDTTPGFHSRYARLVADHVKALDLDASPVLDALGLHDSHAPDAPDQPDWVSAERLTLALHRAAAVCRDPHIGLHIGQQVRPANIGSLGYALVSCGDLSDGLALFERLQSLVCTAVRAEHVRKGELLDNRLHAIAPLPRDPQLWSLVMVSRLAFARWVAGRALHPLLTWLPCPAPADPLPLLNYIGGPVVFDAPHAGERVPLEWLALPNPHADPSVHRLMSADIDQQWAQMQQAPAPLLGVLREHIARHLGRGRLPTLADLAPDLQDALGLSPRQLQRRLGEQGQPLRELIEQVRRDQVLHALRHTALPLAEVAERAAYAELSSLNRAVRRWTGLTPMAVRVQAASSATPAGISFSP